MCGCGWVRTCVRTRMCVFFSAVCLELCENGGLSFALSLFVAVFAFLSLVVARCVGACVFIYFCDYLICRLDTSIIRNTSHTKGRSRMYPLSFAAWCMSWLFWFCTLPSDSFIRPSFLWGDFDLNRRFQRVFSLHGLFFGECTFL